jgi:hypothetical protein
MQLVNRGLMPRSLVFSCVAVIVCMLSLIVCIVLCTVLCLSVLCFLHDMCTFVLCLIVVPLTLGKTPFAVQLINNNNNNNNNNKF